MNFFFVVKSIEYVIDASGNKTQYINVSIRRIFWDKDILSYDDPLDYKLTSNDIRSNAVFLKKN